MGVSTLRDRRNFVRLCSTQNDLAALSKSKKPICATENDMLYFACLKKQMLLFAVLLRFCDQGEDGTTPARLKTAVCKKFHQKTVVFNFSDKSGDDAIKKKAVPFRSNIQHIDSKYKLLKQNKKLWTHSLWRAVPCSISCVVRFPKQWVFVGRSNKTKEQIEMTFS